MKKILLVLLVAAALSCSKDEKSDFIWEKISGKGQANYAAVTSDSLFFFAGTKESRPWALKTDRSGITWFSYVPALEGSFTSALEDTSGIYLAGSSEGQLLIAKITAEGDEVWTHTVDAAAEILTASVTRFSDDSFVAVAGDHPDSVRYNSFLMVYFDREGNILEVNEPAPGYRVAAGDAACGEAGELYLAITKKTAGDKSKASVSRVSPEGVTIWERELYNNPEYSAASLSVKVGDDGMIYASGSTELSSGDDLLMNSWVTALTPSGDVSWKNYLENSNAGEEVVIDRESTLLVINRNCGIINYLSLPDGMVSGRLRTYDACDPYNTGARLFSMDVADSGDYIIAGSKSGKFYYALRSVKTNEGNE